MAQMIKSVETKIVTKNGETQLSITIEPIVIEINVNLKNDTIVSSLATSNTVLEKTVEPVKEDPTQWIAPNFGAKRIKFGKEG